MNVRVLSVGIALFFLCYAFIPAHTFADATSSVQDQISQNNQQINQLEQEIAGYQKTLNQLGTQKQTLQSAINSIDTTKKKTAAQIKVTQTQISVANLQLNQLGVQILTKQQAIELDKQTIASSIRQIASTDSMSPVVSLLSSNSLTDAWVSVDMQVQLNEALQKNTALLSNDQEQLANKQQQVAVAKDSLTKLNTNLQTQNGQLTATEKAKQQLLTQTKNTESTYQNLIAQKKAQEKIFEQQLAQLQSQLKGVTSSQIPHAGQGILSWPFSDTVMANCKSKQGALGNPYCVTQYFGNTAFATANASIYNGMGHDGIDIGVPIGTPVEAALSGVVLGTGNTDLAHDAAGNQCYSFGKWVMIKHANGLDTLYGHLSEIDVSKGQAVTTGDVIGYSGMTGYATGPHLHFGVYASAGVQIMDLGQWRTQNAQAKGTPCTLGGAVLPVSPTNGYLNPLSYL